MINRIEQERQMSKSSIFCVLLVLFSATCFAQEKKILKGSFTNQKKTYPLKGEFVKTADGKWTTTFYFTFGKRGKQVFKGTAEGSLEKGKLKGEVVERRKFVFEGEWKDGKFTGKTAEYFKGKDKPSPTGTIELKVEK